jgi:hypothetical protein
MRHDSGARQLRLIVTGPLSGRDVTFLRGVVDDREAGAIRNCPAALRNPTSEKVSGGLIRLALRGSGPADATAPQIADQVLASGWVEVANAYPMERTFEGLPRA